MGGSEGFGFGSEGGGEGRSIVEVGGGLVGVVGGREGGGEGSTREIEGCLEGVVRG